MTPTPDAAHGTAETDTVHPVGWRGRWSGWLPVFGIAGLAAGLPLFRVLGPHPEFFLAHEVDPSGVVVFAAFAAVVVPVALATVVTVVGRWSTPARTALVAVIATVAVAGLLQGLAGFVFFPALAIAGGAMVAVWERKSEAFRSGLAVAAVMSLLAAGWFVGLSRTSTYVFSSDSDPIELGTAIDDLPPVVFLVFDEFPATALLDSDLEINAERFPNLARLADQSDWFWKASSVSPQTSWSVPALLSGTAPSDAVAVGSNYPSNLFRQLGGAYEVFDYEPITALCPASVCGDAATSVERTRPDASLSRLFYDTAVVFGHAVGSDAIRDSLPAIDHSWSGFGADTLPAAVDTELGEYGELGSEATFAGAVARLQLLVENQASGDRPPLYAAHLLAPHMPYMAVPDGTFYEIEALAGMDNRNGGLVWPEPAEGDADAARTSEAHRRQGYQRLVFQLGALDRVLGDVMAALEAAGVWDDAAVVVTADHGASFEPGAFRSVTHGGAEVWNVPLFIKAPGQSDGQRRDDAALTIDALPTLMGLLGLPHDTSFDGVDLAGDEAPPVRPDAYLDGAGSHTIDQSDQAVRDVVERRADWFSVDGGWDEVLKAGPGGHLVGAPVPVQAAPASGTWTASVHESGTVQPFQRFDVALDSNSVELSAVLVAVDGRIVGAGSPLAGSSPGSLRAWTVIDPTVEATFDRVSLYGVGPDDTLLSLTHSP